MSKEHENRWSGTGNIGWEPELRDAGATKVLNLRLATGRRRKDGDEWSESTVWVNVPIFGRRAEGLARVLHKGDMVYVSGPIDTREYSKKDGSKGFSVEVFADKVVLCGGGKGQQQQHAAAAPAASGTFEDEDLPF